MFTIWLPQVLVYIQILSLMDVIFDIAWPEEFAQMMGVLGIFNFSLGTVPVLSCIFKDIDYYHSYLLWCAMPLATLFLVLMFVSIINRNLLGIEQQIFLACAHKSVLVFLFMTYTPVSMNILSIFNCKELYGTSYIESDLTKECYTHEHLLHLIPGMIAVLAYPIGVPVFYALSLRKLNLSEILRQKKFSTYLYQGCQRYLALHVAGTPGQESMPGLPEHAIHQMHKEAFGKAAYLFSRSVSNQASLGPMLELL
jgi:hypothetical protein